MTLGAVVLIRMKMIVVQGLSRVVRVAKPVTIKDKAPRMERRMCTLRHSL